MARDADWRPARGSAERWRSSPRRRQEPGWPLTLRSRAWRCLSRPPGGSSEIPFPFQFHRCSDGACPPPREASGAAKQLACRGEARRPTSNTPRSRCRQNPPFEIPNPAPCCAILGTDRSGPRSARPTLSEPGPISTMTKLAAERETRNPPRLPKCGQRDRNGDVTGLLR